jgi:hypothetical protein
VDTTLEPITLVGGGAVAAIIGVAIWRTTASLSPCFGGPLAEGFLRAVISSECNSNMVVEKQKEDHQIHGREQFLN